MNKWKNCIFSEKNYSRFWSNKVLQEENFNEKKHNTIGNSRRKKEWQIVKKVTRISKWNETNLSQAAAMKFFLIFWNELFSKQLTTTVVFFYISTIMADNHCFVGRREVGKTRLMVSKLVFFVVPDICENFSIFLKWLSGEKPYYFPKK